MATKIYKSQKQIMIEQRRKLEKQAAALEQMKADMEYIAMEADIELDTEDDDAEEAEE